MRFQPLRIVHDATAFPRGITKQRLFIRFEWPEKQF
jgi:hypothetical protein